MSNENDFYERTENDHPMGRTAVHEFVMPPQGEKWGYPAALFGRIRENINELPETKTTFQLPRIRDNDRKPIPDEMLWLLGSWKVPDVFNQGTTLKYVNPNSADRHLYADITVDCEYCDGRIGDAHGKNPYTNEYAHSDCSQPVIDMTTEQLHTKRHEWIQAAARLGMKGSEIAPRMGSLNKEMASDAAKYCGLSLSEERAIGTRITERTWHYLREGYNPMGDYQFKPHSVKTIARAYGVSESTVSRYTNRYDEHAMNVPIKQPAHGAAD